MNYFDEIFFRNNIQQIREFFLNGSDCKVDPRSYEERTESARDLIAKQLQKKYNGLIEFDEIMELIYGFENVIEAVNMEIGIKTGARLILELLK